MSIFKAVQKVITLDGTGAATVDIPLTSFGGAARLVSHYLKYAATAAGTSVQLSSSLDGRNIGAAIVGNTAVETAVDKVVAQAVRVVVTAGTGAGTVTITLFLDAV